VTRQVDCQHPMVSREVGSRRVPPAGVCGAAMHQDNGRSAALAPGSVRDRCPANIDLATLVRLVQRIHEPVRMLRAH
jgi:hypothetical protein